MENETLTNYFQTPRESQINNAKKSLGEDANRTKHAEGLIDEWINTLPYFPKNYDRNLLRTFLRFCKSNIEKTKEKFECYHLTKNAYPEVYSDRNPLDKDIEMFLQTAKIAVLPNYTETAERVYIMKLGNAMNDFTMARAMRYFFMLYDLILTSPHLVSSEILIMDGSGFTASHFPEFVSQNFKTFMNILKEAYPVRLKHIHIVNAPSMAEKWLNIAKPIFPEKIRKRFTIHKSTDTLLEAFSEKVLPKEYGGFQKSVEEYAEDCLRIMQSNVEWYKSQETAKITIEVPKYKEIMSELGGIQGSFRKLDID